MGNCGRLVNWKLSHSRTKKLHVCSQGSLVCKYSDPVISVGENQRNLNLYSAVIKSFML